MLKFFKITANLKMEILIKEFNLNFIHLKGSVDSGVDFLSRIYSIVKKEEGYIDALINQYYGILAHPGSKSF
ncbi:hypothetical protein A0H76_1273 [Hepatospora eriocheir]|uniref:Uncharacterized protein n=1 Tax=Hepatospora eriocheir TaxID=1081669 RepID=A0A1X0QHF2_9MICR|nr:hypothetical protein A0H76_1273 [Hepatospora eriocheir]